jgi:hypothetical protein
MSDDVSDVAHILSGLCGGVCCHMTGGRGASKIMIASGICVGGDEGHCECRDAAREIIARLRRQEGKG